MKRITVETPQENAHTLDRLQTALAELKAK
jgi:hypothetical protein